MRITFTQKIEYKQTKFENKQIKFRLNQWFLIAPQGIPYQTDSNSSGPLECLDASNIIQKTPYVCLDEELIYLRYYTASAIGTSEETVEMEKKCWYGRI